MKDELSALECAKHCVALSRICRDAGDAIYIIKLVAHSLVLGVLDVRVYPLQSDDDAVASLVTTSAAVFAVEVGATREHLVDEVGKAFDFVVAQRAANAAKRGAGVTP